MNPMKNLRSYSYDRPQLTVPLPASLSLQKPKQERGKSSPKPKRARGVILTLHGWDKLQAAKSHFEFQENAGDRFTLEELSERTGLSVRTISKVLGRSEPVDKYSLQTMFRSFGLELRKSEYARPTSSFEALETRQGNQQQDWGEAVDVSMFYGRAAELKTLRQWVLEEHCRLVAVLGIGGIGKSLVAVKLALQIQQEFEVVIWRSLENAPPLEEWLESVLPFLLRAQGKDHVLADSVDGRLSQLMECLRTSRCLLLLDAQTIFSEGQLAGQYRAGYEGYGQLLRAIGESPHQSCVILTSREKPSEIALMEGPVSRVRSLLLGGLKPDEGRELFQQKGTFTGSQTEWRTLIEYYGGNPLALKLVAATTQDLFNGQISEVLKYAQQGLLVSSDIRDVLDRQFNRLSQVEQELMLWLAINQEPVSFAELREDVVSAASKRELPEILNSLLRRSLVEQNTARFSLQPVVMQYVTRRLLQQVCYEIAQQQISLLKTHALFKAQAKDYVREMQKRLIVQPIIEWLLTELGSQREIEQRLREMLQQHRQASLQPGYVASNLLNLLVQLQAHLPRYDFSELAVWQADLRRVNGEVVGCP